MNVQIYFILFVFLVFFFNFSLDSKKLFHKSGEMTLFLIKWPKQIIIYLLLKLMICSISIDEKAKCFQNVWVKIFAFSLCTVWVQNILARLLTNDFREKMYYWKQIKIGSTKSISIETAAIVWQNGEKKSLQLR